MQGQLPITLVLGLATSMSMLQQMLPAPAQDLLSVHPIRLVQVPSAFFLHLSCHALCAARSGGTDLEGMPGWHAARMLHSTLAPAVDLDMQQAVLAAQAMERLEALVEGALLGRNAPGLMWGPQLLQWAHTHLLMHDFSTASLLKALQVTLPAAWQCHIESL